MQHARLDGRWRAPEHHYTRARYVGLLRAHLGVHGALEARIARWLPEVAMPSRTACLVHDLEQLGEAAAPAPVVAPALATLPEAYGAAYVVEGSTLGGLVLAERFEAALGAGTPTSFLRLRGAGTAARWRAFLGELERAEPSLAADDQRRACDVAVETFATFSDAFDALESHA